MLTFKLAQLKYVNISILKSQGRERSRLTKKKGDRVQLLDKNIVREFLNAVQYELLRESEDDIINRC